MWVQIRHTMTSYPRNKESLHSLLWKAQMSADQGECCFALGYWVGGVPVRQNSTNVTANNSKL